jgi:hypothetical protein
VGLGEMEVKPLIALGKTAADTTKLCRGTLSISLMRWVKLLQRSGLLFESKSAKQRWIPTEAWPGQILDQRFTLAGTAINAIAM